MSYLEVCMTDKENCVERKNRVQFDREYSTTYKSEVNWLSKHGIRYTFVKEINSLTNYKYKKFRIIFRTR